VETCEVADKSRSTPAKRTGWISAWRGADHGCGRKFLQAGGGTQNRPRPYERLTQLNDLWGPNADFAQYVSFRRVRTLIHVVSRRCNGSAAGDAGPIDVLPVAIFYLAPTPVPFAEVNPLTWSLALERALSSKAR
jgi:hypothetical protein